MYLTVVFPLISLLLILAPLPFASVKPLHSSILTLSIYSTGLVWCFIAFFGKLRLKFSWFAWAFLAYLAWNLLHIIPLPSAILEAISPGWSAAYTQNALTKPAVGTLSLTPVLTRRELVELIALALVYIIVSNFAGKRLLIGLSIAVILAGLVQAGCGIVNYMSGANIIFGFENRYAGGFASGTFINRNHYAAFLEICIPVSLGLFLYRLDRIASGAGDWRETLVRVFSDKNIPILMVPVGMVLMLIGLLLSGSRGGMAAMGLSLIAYLAALFMHYRARVVRIGLALLAACAVLCSLWIVGERFDRVLGHFQKLTSSIPGREAIWRDSLSMANAFLLTGAGLGSYQHIIPHYEHRTQFDGLYTNHAHNEYLETACEAGLPGLALLIIGGITAIMRALRERQLLKWGCAAAILSVSVHNLVDFNTRMPANALLYIILFAMLEIRTNSSSRVPSTLVGVDQSVESHSRKVPLITFTILTVLTFISFQTVRLEYHLAAIGNALNVLPAKAGMHTLKTEPVNLKRIEPLLDKAERMQSSQPRFFYYAARFHFARMTQTPPTEDRLRILETARSYATKGLALNPFDRILTRYSKKLDRWAEAMSKTGL